MRLPFFLALAAFTFTPACWGQAINPLTETQWVRPSNDVLTGRVVTPSSDATNTAVSNAWVAVFDTNGNVRQSRTNARGEFKIENVKPGVYAFASRADYIFAYCALHVLGSSESNQKYPSSIEVAAANIDYTTVKTAIIRYSPPTVKQIALSLSGAEFDGLAAKTIGAENFRVAQSGDGLRGRIHAAGATGSDLVDANLTNVFLVKDKIQAAHVITDERGEFVVEKLDPGQYSLMAIGPHGLGMLSFELVANNASTARTTSDGKTLVGVAAEGCCGQVAMQVAPIMPNFVDTCCQEVIIEEPIIETCGCGQPIDTCGCEVIDPCGCGAGIPVEEGVAGVGYGGFMGGGGGGFYGGGGGGGGLGGLGGLAAAAAIPIAAIALSDDDDGASTITSPPVSTPSTDLDPPVISPPDPPSPAVPN